MDVLYFILELVSDLQKTCFFIFYSDIIIVCRNLPFNVNKENPHPWSELDAGID